MIAPTADLKLLSGRTLSTLSDRFPPAPLLSSSATTTQVFPRRAAEDACATVGAAAAGAPWRLGVGIRAHLSPDPTIQAGRLATDFETPLPSLSASPLGVGMRSHDGDQVSAMMRSALERAVAAAAMMPGEPKLPANYSARKEVLSHRSSPAMSALSTPYASCDNLGALWGAAGEGALSSEVSPRLHPVSAAIAHVPPLQSPSSLAGYSIAPPAAAALPSPAAPASGGGAADGTLLVERPRSAPASAFCAQCTLDGLAVEGLPSPRTCPSSPGRGVAATPMGAAAAVRQQITVLPGESAQLPRIVNLKSACSDGLLLLSSTASIIARDAPGDDAADGAPPAKRAKA